MKLNNIALASIICTALIMVWHFSPLATPQIIPSVENPDLAVPYGMQPVVDNAQPGNCNE